MSIYDIIKILHILAVIALIGPLLLTPKWLYLYQNSMGRKLLHEIHFVTGIAGWMVLISGVLMLFLFDGELLSSMWMQVSLVLFIAIQLFDHFWSDAREDELESSPNASVATLKNWLIIKLGLYCCLVILMTLQP